MSGNYSQLEWQEEKNDVTIDCTLDIAVHPANSSVILLTVPGVDGSVDGYENKYVRIADSVQEQHGAAVVRTANPFITSFHWESNIRHILDFINHNAQDICGNHKPEIRIMAHSAGAAIIGQIAWNYPNVSRLLLINPATKLGLNEIKEGLAKFGGNKITVLFGSKDPGAITSEELSKADESARMRTLIIEGADHHFSGKYFSLFLQSPHSHLFNQSIFI